MMHAMRKRLPSTLIWTHRYLGIPLSLLFLMWFLTGIGMIYSRGMPRLTSEMRLARLAPLDLDQVRLSPSEAADRAGLLFAPVDATLLTVLDRPAYRFSERGTTIVFADTGEVFDELELDDAIRIASLFLGVSAENIGYGDLITQPDQWTLSQGLQLPMYKLVVDDGAGSEVYVAPREGEVVQFTTRRGRLLSWVSVIPHFLYFKALRMRGETWYGIMTWGPGLGVIVSVLGLVVGFMHFRPTRPFRLSKLRACSPFAGGLGWHHTTGVVFGVLTLTFVLSGLLSMEPWEWTQRDDTLGPETRAAFPDGTGRLEDYASIEAVDWSNLLAGREIKEIQLTRILDEAHFVVRSAPGRPAEMGWPDGGHQPYFVERSSDSDRAIIAAATGKVKGPLAADVIRARIAETMPETPIVSVELLAEYDSYYYSREGRSPLPVLRVQLDEPQGTWLYVDPGTARIVGRINRINRMERWLYAGLHTLDFPFLYDRRPLWDALVILICLGGAALSGIGLWLGLKRMAGGILRPAAAGRG
jgi:uncharacterized iron-regulated membrane protein